MGIVLWLGKPVLYIAMFWIAAALLRRHFPARRGAVALRGIGGGLGRLAIGALLGFVFTVLSDSIPREALYGAFFLCGSVAWVAVAAMAFRGAPLRPILVFAMLGEAIGGGIDAWAFHELSHIRFC